MGDGIKMEKGNNFQNKYKEMEETKSLTRQLEEEEDKHLEENRIDMEREESKKQNKEETDEEKEKKKRKLEELRERQQEALNDIESRTDVQTVSEFIDEEGNVISARKKGRVSLKMLNIEKEITQVKRFREDDSNDLHGLQESIRRYGLLEPVHVVPFGDHYILVQGYRRLQAYINLGKQHILAIVDTTIPPELTKYFQVEMNNILKYTFIEKLKYGKFVETTQRQLSTDAIEQSLGLKAGEYLKMKYIEQFKNDFPDIFKQVVSEKLSIEQAYKKIDKEIEKQEKELDNMDNEELDEKLRNEDLSEIQGEANQQELGKRKPLDASTRRFVESRAGGKCECCGYGEDEPDLMVVFKVHHIIPVMFGGSDSKINLGLVCNNCHDIIHKYERSEFFPEQDTYDRRNDIKRTVVLGNIILKVRKKAIHLLRTKYHNIGKQVDKGVITLGQGIHKSGMDLNGEGEYEGGPYTAFIKATEDLNFGGDISGDLAGIDHDGSEEKEEQKGNE